MVRLIKGLDGLICKTEILVLTLGIICMAGNSIANVIGRYVFSQSLYFSEELNEFFMIIITFFGLGYVTRQGRHIRMSAIYDNLPNRARKVLMIAISAATAVVMLVLAYYAYQYIAKVYIRGKITPALSVPVWLTYIWVVAGFSITGIQYLLTAARNLDLSDETVYLSYTKVDSYENEELAELVDRATDKAGRVDSFPVSNHVEEVTP